MHYIQECFEGLWRGVTHDFSLHLIAWRLDAGRWSQQVQCFPWLSLLFVAWWSCGFSGGKQVSDKKPDLHSPCFLFFLFKSQAPLGQDSSCKTRNRKNRKQAKIKWSSEGECRRAPPPAVWDPSGHFHLYRARVLHEYESWEDNGVWSGILSK